MSWRTVESFSLSWAIPWAHHVTTRRAKSTEIRLLKERGYVRVQGRQPRQHPNLRG